MTFKKKLMTYIMTVVLAVVVTIGSASACTMLYVGSDLTDTGEQFVARSEDYSNSYNKIAYVSEHGKHLAGETYVGCDFTFTFTHDSYAYTSVRDDNLAGVCPNCGGTHQHTPMEEAGTNEMGLSVSAMDTVSSNGKYKSIDPMVKNGMCEGDMETVLLGECASAKEAVDLLCSIYDTVGALECSGVLIADQNEAWYVENYTGTQYVAIKLSSSLVAFNPNVGIIGLVDLDDTENVIASANVIAFAKEAGCYVGDEEANTIDYRASYGSQRLETRVYNGLNFLNGVDTFTADTTTAADFVVSNVKDGEIVTMYSAIAPQGKVSIQTMIDFYKVSAIGKSGNLEWHIFAIDPKGTEMEKSTVEWLGMNHAGYSVAIPYYPMLTTEMYEGYMVGGIGGCTFVTEQPDGSQTFYPTTKRGTAGFNVYPEGWENGVYWANDVLSNFAESSMCSAEDNAMIKAELAKMQDKCLAKAAEMKAAVADMDGASAKLYCTAESKALAKEAHELAVALYKEAALDQHSFENGKCVFCGAKQPGFNPFVDIDSVNASFKAAILWAAENNIVFGYDASHFVPGKQCSRAEALTFLWRAAGCPAPKSSECPFSDVDAGSYYYKALLWAAENGIAFGYADGSFKPAQLITRGQFAAFMWRAAGSPEPTQAADFSDVAADSYCAKAIAWGVENGIINGYANGTFAPNAGCTRAHAAAFLFKAAK